MKRLALDGFSLNRQELLGYFAKSRLQLISKLGLLVAGSKYMFDQLMAYHICSLVG